MLGILGLGQQFDSKVMACLWTRTSNKIITYVIASFGSLIPNLLVGFLYFKVFKTTYEAKKEALNRDFVFNERLRLSLGFSRGMFASFFCFMVAFLPYGLILILDFDNSLPRYIHMLGYIAVKFNSILNSILYGSTCELFLKGI